MFAEFINEYGTTILYALVTAIGGYIGIVLKNIYKNYINDKTKREVVKTAVQYVEQVYSSLESTEKFNEACKAASDMLLEKGITISELELKVLIEAAVNEISNAFNEGTAKTTTKKTKKS